MPANLAVSAIDDLLMPITSETLFFIIILFYKYPMYKLTLLFIQSNIFV